jgi:hypothetical protein
MTPMSKAMTSLAVVGDQQPQISGATPCRGHRQGIPGVFICQRQSDSSNTPGRR